MVEILIAKEHTAPVMASKLFGHLNDLWQYGCTKGYCESNITLNIHRKSIFKPRQEIHLKKISDISLFKELVSRIYFYAGNPTTKNALRFLLHVPLRANNLVNLEWSSIDLKKRLLTIPRRLMKTKDINLPDFKMPLTDEVVNILKEQQGWTHTKKYIFPSPFNSLKHIHQETCNKALKQMGFTGEHTQTQHSFRGSFRSLVETYQSEHKAREEIKEIALDHHNSDKTIKAYKHKADYTAELKILMNWWSEFVMRLKDKE